MGYAIAGLVALYLYAKKKNETVSQAAGQVTSEAVGYFGQGATLVEKTAQGTSGTTGAACCGPNTGGLTPFTPTPTAASPTITPAPLPGPPAPSYMGAKSYMVF